MHLSAVSFILHACEVYAQADATATSCVPGARPGDSAMRRQGKFGRHGLASISQVTVAPSWVPGASAACLPEHQPLAIHNCTHRSCCYCCAGHAAAGD